MDQSEVQSGIPQQLFDREFALATMDQILPTPISLSSLKNMYEEPHRTRLPRARATRLLSTPQRVFVDPHFTVPTMSPELQFSSTRAHVDALLMIPNTIGLDALLPILGDTSNSVSLPSVTVTVLQPLPIAANKT